MEFNSNSASLQQTLLLQKEVIQNIELEIILFVNIHFLTPQNSLIKAIHIQMREKLRYSSHI